MRLLHDRACDCHTVWSIFSLVKVVNTLHVMWHLWGILFIIFHKHEQMFVQCTHLRFVHWTMSINISAHALDLNHSSHIKTSAFIDLILHFFDASYQYSCVQYISLNLFRNLGSEKIFCFQIPGCMRKSTLLWTCLCDAPWCGFHEVFSWHVNQQTFGNVSDQIHLFHLSVDIYVKCLINVNENQTNFKLKK